MADYKSQMPPTANGGLSSLAEARRRGDMYYMTPSGKRRKVPTAQVPKESFQGAGMQTQYSPRQYKVKGRSVQRGAPDAQSKYCVNKILLGNDDQPYIAKPSANGIVTWQPCGQKGNRNYEACQTAEYCNVPFSPARRQDLYNFLDNYNSKSNSN